MGYANDYIFSAIAHHGRLQRHLQAVYKGREDCRFDEREFFSRAIFCVRSFSMPRRKTRASFEHVSEFDRGRIVAYRDCGLSFREIGHRVGRSQATVMRICNRWMQEGTTDRQQRLQPPRRTTPREDRHIVRMAMVERTATSAAISQGIQCVTQQSVSARTIRRRLQYSGLSARRPLLRLPLTLNHRRFRLQWCSERRRWTSEWHDIVFSDESRFCLQYHDGRIRVWRHRGERLLNCCVMHRHTGPAPGVMVWGGIGFTSRTPLVRITGTLTSQRYISEVLQPVLLPYLQGLPAATFQQDNARPHIARNVQAFFLAHHIALLPWPACSPDLSPIEHVWSVIGERLARHDAPACTPDELWLRVEAAWAAIPQQQIQSLFYSMPRRVAAVIDSRGGNTHY